MPHLPKDATVAPAMKEYVTTSINNEFASWSHVQTSIEFVSLVVKVVNVEERQTSTFEPYVVLHGKDIEGVTTPSVKLWRF